MASLQPTQLYPASRLTEAELVAADPAATRKLFHGDDLGLSFYEPLGTSHGKSQRLEDDCGMMTVSSVYSFTMVN